MDWITPFLGNFVGLARISFAHFVSVNMRARFPIRGTGKVAMVELVNCKASCYSLCVSSIFRLTLYCIVNDYDYVVQRVPYLEGNAERMCMRKRRTDRSKGVSISKSSKPYGEYCNALCGLKIALKHE